MSEEKHGSSGFFLGLAIGVAVGALVSTKKGRDILKDLADYGLEYVGNAVNLGDFEGIMDEEEEVVSGEMEAQHVTEDVADKAVDVPAPTKKRRLFRGIRKK